MIIPDTNLLLYAIDSSSPFHKRTAEWWSSCLSGDETIGLAQSVIFGFMRVSTHRKAFASPLTPSEAASHIRTWLDQPPVEILVGENSHIEDVLTLLEKLGTAGNLVSDAQLAALAIEYDAVLYSADADFSRFPGLRWHNPLNGASRPSSRRKN